MHGSHDLQLPGINKPLDDRASLDEACCGQAGVRFGDLLHQRVIVRIAMTIRLVQGGERGPEIPEQRGNIAQLDAIDCAFDRPAGAVSEYNNGLGAHNLG